MTASDRAELGRSIVALALGMRTQIAAWLALIGDFDAAGGTSGTRFAGTAEWLAFECRLTGRTARDHVRVARRLRELPLVAHALAEGQLSYSQTRAITRASPAEDERSLLEVALRSTTDQLERHVRALRSATSADVDATEASRSRRCLEWFYADDGTLKFYGRLPVEVGAAFVEVIETAAATLHPGPEPQSVGDGDARPRRIPSRSARRADALAEVALSGAPRAQLVLHADPAALACRARGDDARAGEVCALDGGPAIPSELARRLCCDAEVSVAGLNLGRTQRVITPALRRALESRDGRCCAMPGCDRRHGLAGHHITHWAHGGRTDLENLVLLCPFHHRLVHEGGFEVRRRDGVVQVRDARGHLLHQTPHRAPPLQLVA